MNLCERILIFVWNIFCLHSLPLPPPPPLPRENSLEDVPSEYFLPSVSQSVLHTFNRSHLWTWWRWSLLPHCILLGHHHHTCSTVHQLKHWQHCHLAGGTQSVVWTQVND